MTPRRLWIVGAGKRVRETALPAVFSLQGEFEIAGILARSPRDLETSAGRIPVRRLDDLRREELAPGDLVYVAVGKDAVPQVLQRLAEMDRSRLELLIDTPVLRFKHLRYRGLLEGWARSGVAEDTIHLPWYATARDAVGGPRSVVFDRAAYAYHALAQAKALCGATRVAAARRVKAGAGAARREIALEGGTTAVTLEPRDYARGRVIVEGPRGRVADRVDAGEDATTLAPIVAGGLCVGFRAGDIETRLEPEEAALTRGDAPESSVTARMESMKRIGFRRLLLGIAGGRPPYSVEDGLEDMAVDWFLERFGRWRRNALTDLNAGLARAVWGFAGRMG